MCGKGQEWSIIKYGKVESHIHIEVWDLQSFHYVTPRSLAACYVTFQDVYYWIFFTKTWKFLMKGKKLWTW